MGSQFLKLPTQEKKKKTIISGKKMQSFSGIQTVFPNSGKKLEFTRQNTQKKQD